MVATVQYTNHSSSTVFPNTLRIQYTCCSSLCYCTVRPSPSHSLGHPRPHLLLRLLHQLLQLRQSSLQSLHIARRPREQQLVVHALHTVAQGPQQRLQLGPGGRTGILTVQVEPGGAELEQMQGLGQGRGIGTDQKIALKRMGWTMAN